ncbi:MAG: hypothetical protein LBT98_01810 [Puniceicoccales bacterium]|jgi:protein tyrosine phosphatase|nr:hypothetical protein [Puniceicoccales bacterium]
MSLSDKNPVSESKQHILRKEGIALSHKSSPWKAIKTRPVLFSVCLVTTLLAMAGTAALILLLPFPLIFLAVPLAALAIGSIGLFILCTCLRKDHSTHNEPIPAPPSQENNKTTDTSKLDATISPMAPTRVQSLTHSEPPSELSSQPPSSVSSTTSSESSSQASRLISPEISFTETAVPFSLPAKISVELSGIEKPTEENVKELLRLLFGENFPVDGSGLGKIDFYSMGKNDILPTALAEYSRKQHGVKTLSSSTQFTTIVFATNGNRSVYRRRHASIPRNRIINASANEQTIWGDISQITATSYVCSSPELLIAFLPDMPKQREFCEILGEEFDGKSLIIADISTMGGDYLEDWKTYNPNSTYASSFPGDGTITNVVMISAIARNILLGPCNICLPIEFVLQSFQLRNKNGRINTFHQLRINGWHDGGGLPPQLTQIILEDYKKFEAKVAKSSGRPQEPVYLLAHCDSGAGRSPSFLIYRDIDRVANACQKLGWAFTCDHENQNQILINGNVNLSWVLCRILQNGINARAVYGQGLYQFPSYAEYANFLAGVPEKTKDKMKSNT